MAWFWNNLYDVLIPNVLKDDKEEKHKIELYNAKIVNNKAYFSGFKQVWISQSNEQKVESILVVNPNATEDNIYVYEPDVYNEEKGFAYERVYSEDDLTNKTYYVETDEDGELYVKIKNFGVEGLKVVILSPEKKDFSRNLTFRVDGTLYAEKEDENGLKYFDLDIDDDINHIIEMEWTEYNSDLRLFCKILFRNLDVMKKRIDLVSEQKLPDKCVEDALDLLALEYGFPILIYSLAEDKRHLLQNIANIYKLKGTEVVFQLIRYLFKFKIEMEQLWSANYKRFWTEDRIEEEWKLTPDKVFNVLGYEVKQ